VVNHLTNPAYPFFHKDKVLDAELSPAVLPVDHGSQRYCGGPVTVAHIRHMRKKATHVPTETGFPLDFLLNLSGCYIIQVNSSHIECHLGGFKQGLFSRDRSMDPLKEIEILFWNYYWCWLLGEP